MLQQGLYYLTYLFIFYYTKNGIIVKMSNVLIVREINKN